MGESEGWDNFQLKQKLSAKANSSLDRSKSPQTSAFLSTFAAKKRTGDIYVCAGTMDPLRHSSDLSGVLGAIDHMDIRGCQVEVNPSGISIISILFINYLKKKNAKVF